MANEITTGSGSQHSNVLGAFEDKIRDFQRDLKDLVSVQNLDDLKNKWSDLSSKTVDEIEEHPFQMIALAGMLGFSLGIAGKRIDVKQASSKALDWAAKLGAAWAVEKISEGKGSRESDKSIH